MQAFFPRSRWFAICISIIFLLSLIPAIPSVLEVGGYTGASPRYIDNYYSAIARELGDGHALVGNPFFWEHRDSIAQAFILPFWLYDLPRIAGLPLVVNAAFNFTLWSLVFGIGAYLFFRKFGLTGAWSALGVVYAYLTVFGSMLVPISMETVYPTFILFLLAFFLWWKRPADHYLTAFLGFAASLAIYDYTYTLQIIGAFLALSFVYLIYFRDWIRVRHALYVGAYIGVLCIPFLMITYTQLHHPHYFETMVRIGLGYTHIPSSEAFRNLARVFSFAVLVYLSWRWIFKTRELHYAAFVPHFLLLGAAIVIVSFSNMITGLDLETASHAARFVKIWIIIGSVIAAYMLIGARSSVGALSLWKKAALAVAIFLVLVSHVHYIQSADTGVQYIDHDRARVRELQAYMPAFQWLDTHVDEQKVVWASPHNPNFLLIPSYTKHYLLFTNVANVLLLTDAEMEERYLLAHAISSPTLETISAELGEYGGGGALLDTPSTINRWVRVCGAFRLSTFGYECGSLVDAQTLSAPRVARMFEKFQTQIQPHMYEMLKKYHVAYIVKNTETDSDFHPERLPFVEEVYSDPSISIYEVK